MPFIAVKPQGKLTQEQKEDISRGMGKIVSILPGKRESDLMLDISEGQTLYFAGKAVKKGAYVDVHMNGDVDFESKKDFTQAIFSLLWQVCGMSKDEIYITFSIFDEVGRRGKLY